MIIRIILLFPFAVLYNGLTRLRNLLFDLQLKPSASFEVPIICVGNLSVGGTGKTPMIEYLIQFLRVNGGVATLSRGYGRKTKGMRMVNKTDTADSVGDEPFQLYQKFADSVTVSVCEERAFAIPYILDKTPDTQVILLDDAFQHRSINCGFTVLLTEYRKPFYTDFLLPAGNLREARKGANRASVIVVTKCPDNLLPEAQADVIKRIRQYTDKPVFFSKIRYGDPVHFYKKNETDFPHIILVSGIANPTHLERHIKEKYTLFKHIVFPDHHRYTEKQVIEITTLAQKNRAAVFTTDKDKSKLFRYSELCQSVDFYTIPIETEFIKGRQEFDAMVEEYVNRNKKI